MSSSVRTTYTIAEAASLSGLPASTLRYYEQIGVIAPISRGASSRHRVYDEADLNRLVSIACLAATGMSVGQMRRYAANAPLGPEAAEEQIQLLTDQQQRLEDQAAAIAVRQRYVRLKIDYWHAVRAGDDARAELISAEARALADELNTTKTPKHHRKK